MMGLAQGNVPFTDTVYFAFQFATVKDSWPVKTNLLISNNLSTFSHVYSNFFMMDRIETAKAFAITWTLFYQPSLLCKSYWFYLASDFHRSHFRSVSLSEKNPLVVLNLFFSNRLATFLCPSFMNFRFWIQHQHLPEIFHTLFDSTRLCMNFNFQPFHIIFSRLSILDSRIKLSSDA